MKWMQRSLAPRISSSKGNNIRESFNNEAADTFRSNFIKLQCYQKIFLVNSFKSNSMYIIQRCMLVRMYLLPKHNMNVFFVMCSTETKGFANRFSVSQVVN
jgi:hypothetical protein